MSNIQETIHQTKDVDRMPDEFVPLHAPEFNGNEKRYLEECIDSTFVSSVGKFVDLFERKVAEYTGAKHAVACVNGTSALQVSLRLAGVLPGEEVIVPTLSFIAPVNAVTYNGATPIFMDADQYYNIDAEKTIEFICNETKLTGQSPRVTVQRKTGKRIAAIVLVHVWGNAAQLDELVLICEERNIAVVEDAAESLGTIYRRGKYAGRHTGTIGKLGCLSFNGNKIITASGGGMIITDDDELASKALYLTTQAKDDSIHYVHKEVGYNFRLTNIQAALGLAQLEQLSEFLECKRVIFSKYKAALKDIEGLTLADVPEYANNNNWLNLLQIDTNTYPEDREKLMARLKDKGIQTRPVWALNHQQKPYKNCQKYRVEQAKKLVNNSLCLPSSTNITDKELQKVITQFTR